MSTIYRLPSRPNDGPSRKESATSPRRLTNDHALSGSLRRNLSGRRAKTSVLISSGGVYIRVSRSRHGSDLRRQPHCDFGEDHQQAEQREHDQVKRDRARDDVAQLARPYALDHEQVDSDWRRDLAHLDEQHQDYAEPDWINAVLDQ